MSIRLQRARDFAWSAHADQRYAGRPYTEHLDEVVKIIQDYGFDEDCQVVGFLHDVLEDTNVTVDLLAGVFGWDTANAVALISDTEGKSRLYRKAEAEWRMSLVKDMVPELYWIEWAMVAKVADRLANVKACIKDGNNELLSMYLRERVQFRRAYYIPWEAMTTMWVKLEGTLISQTNFGQESGIELPKDVPSSKPENSLDSIHQLFQSNFEQFFVVAFHKDGSVYKLNSGGGDEMVREVKFEMEFIGEDDEMP